VQVRLTAAGQRRVDAAFTDLLDREHAILEALRPSERDALAGLLRTLLIPFDADGKARRTG
jgi:hypothetical protein